eukprot:m51a1_g6615 hypothetical protein (602) ;mRNA; f:31167-33461
MWRCSFGFNTESAIDALLERRAGCTLDDLLVEDEFLPELKSRNKMLIKYLSDRNNICRAIDVISSDAPQGSTQIRIYKFPFMCCEVLCSDLWPSDNALLPRLLSFVRPLGEPPLSAALSSYCSKSAVYALDHGTCDAAQTLQLVSSVPDLARRLSARVSEPGVCDVLARIARVEGADRWLADNGVVEALVSAVPDNEDAASALVSLLGTGPAAQSPVAQRLGNEDVLRALLNTIFSMESPQSAVISGLQVLEALLRGHKGEKWREAPGEVPEAVRVVAGCAAQFRGLIDVPADSPEILQTTFGALRPPLGLRRMQAVSVIVALIGTRQREACMAVVNGNLVHELIALFFRYEWHTLLSQAVTEAITVVLDSPWLDTVADVLRATGLLHKIASLEMSSRRMLPGRSPLISHTTRILAKVSQVASSDVDKAEDIRGLLEMVPAWQDFIEESVKQRLDDQSRLLGGFKPERTAADNEALAREAYEVPRTFTASPVLQKRAHEAQPVVAPIGLDADPPPLEHRWAPPVRSGLSETALLMPVTTERVPLCEVLVPAVSRPTIAEDVPFYEPEPAIKEDAPPCAPQATVTEAVVVADNGEEEWPLLY